MPVLCVAKGLSPRHPVGENCRETRLNRRVYHLVVVVDERHHPASGQPAQHIEFEPGGWAEVTVGAHVQFGVGQPVSLEPGLRHLPQPLRAPGQPDDLVTSTKIGHETRALLEQSVAIGSIEEPIPGPTAGQMMQPMPDVGDDTVDVEDGEPVGTRRPICTGRTHRQPA